MKYHIITYGCQMNKSDSERIARILESIGHKSASRIEEADLVVVNMCSVRQSAVDRVWGLAPKFRKLKTKNPQLKTVLTGCILKRDKRKFSQDFDLILDIKDLSNWPKYLSRISDGRRKVETACSSYLEIQPQYSQDFSAFVAIMTGCNNFCSYCVVPYARGQEICRPAKEILDEVKNLIKRGFKEIWLLGQNVNSYKSGKLNFPELLQMVNGTPDNFWIRFTSSHPKDFSDELIGAMATCQKVSPYLNLPVQSGDNEILKKMNRPYTVEQYKNLVKKIRQAMPDICLSTDVIVGFPGETQERFENTAQLFKEIKFDMAYIAQYSPRSGTAAAKLEDNIAHQEKERRDKALTEILKETAWEKNKKFIGQKVDVLVNSTKNIRENSCSNSCKFVCFGKSWHYKTVKFESEKDLIGQFVKVKIIDAMPWGLKGVF